MSFPARLGACLLFVLPLACGEIPLEPSAVTGVWALETVDGLAVPAPAMNNSLESVVFVSDTLELASDGTFGGRRCEVRVNHDTDLETAACVAYAGTYTLRVRALELWYLCPLSTTCYGSTSRSGTVRDGRLVLDGKTLGPDLGYARVE